MKLKKAMIGLSLALALPLSLIGLLEVGLRFSPLDNELGPERFHGNLMDHSLFWDPENILINGWDDLQRKNEFRRAKVVMPKAQGLYRIISLGGSFTFGWPYGKPEDAKDIYPAVLQGLLNKSRAETEPRYEVINAGVGGYTSYQGLNYLEKRLIKLNPDMITVAFGANDSADNASIGVTISDREYFEMRATQRDSPVAAVSRSLLTHSRVLALADRAVLTAKVALSPIQNRVPPDEFRSNLEEMFALVRKHEAKLVLLYEPHWEVRPLKEELELNPHYAILEQMAREHPGEVVLLDTISLTVKALPGRKDELFKDYMHLTRAGHRWMARFLHDEMRKVPGLLPR